MRIDSASLAVLGDSREERGQGRAPLWLVEARASAYAYAYADADADAYASADASAYASASASADAYASAYADDDASQSNLRSPKMKDGIYAVTLTQSGRTVLRVGWFRRDTSEPDEYEVTWCTPYRGEYQTQLGDVWANGPKAAPAWKWGKPVPSVAHRIHFQPLARLDAKHWADICPRPKGWES